MKIIKRHDISAYFVMAFVFSWGVILILAGPGNIPISAETTKVPMPLLYITMLLGPSVAGILLTALVDGKAGMSRLKSRLLKFRAGIRWYAAALLVAPLLASLILFVLSLISSNFYIAVFKFADPTSLLMNGIISGIMVGIFEELGWSGFVIPRLRQRYNSLGTGLLVGILWGAWHFILFWETGSFSGMLPFFILLGRLFAWLPPYRILMVWLYNHTESLPVVILSHASLVFTVTALVPMSLTGTALLTWILIWSAVLWIVVALVSILKKQFKVI